MFGANQRRSSSNAVLNISRVVPMLMLFVTLHGNAACPSYNEVVKYVDAYWARTPLRPIIGVTNLTEAYCAQARVAAEIGWHMGVPAGYRVALSSAESQQSHGIGHPIRGFLFERMFLNNNDSIPADFAGRPVAYADLVAVAKDGSFQRTATAQQLLEDIKYFIPIIQLSDDIGGDTQSTTTAMDLISSNLGTRFAILGAPIPVEAHPTFYEKLAAMRVVIRNGRDQELSVVRGAEILGHPLNALHWLGKELEYNAQRIQPGDMLSVGQFGPAIPVYAGDEIKVQYLGLPGDPIVNVRFTQPVGQLTNVADKVDCFTAKKTCHPIQPQ
jgi:2-keto-4-pentenoate hydratase